MVPLQGLYRMVTVAVVLSVGLAAVSTEALSSEPPVVVVPAVDQWVPDPMEAEWLDSISEQIQQIETERHLARAASEKASIEMAAFAEAVRQDMGEQEKTIRDREKRISEIEDLTPPEYRDMVLDYADQYDLDPRMLAAVISVESQWEARAQGKHGDTGLMQIVPGTAEWIASVMGIQEYNLYNPETNLTMGAWYLHVLYEEYGNWPQALAAYNGGPKLAPLGLAHPYVTQVLAQYEKKGS